jgi:hypothetical protein
MRSRRHRDTRGAPGASLPLGYPRRREVRCARVRAGQYELRAAVRWIKYWKTHSIVKSGETTAPYCAALALLGSVPFVLGEIVSVQMPHQHRNLGYATHTASVFTRRRAYIQTWNALAKVRRMARPFPQATLKILRISKNIRNGQRAGRRSGKWARAQ